VRQSTERCWQAQYLEEVCYQAKPRPGTRPFVTHVLQDNVTRFLLFCSIQESRESS